MMLFIFLQKVIENKGPVFSYSLHNKPMRQHILPCSDNNIDTLKLTVTGIY